MVIEICTMVTCGTGVSLKRPQKNFLGGDNVFGGINKVSVCICQNSLNCMSKIFKFP